MISQNIKNLDIVNHIIKSGIEFDPALGKWGDGYLYANGSFLTNNTVYTGGQVPDSLIIKEKGSGAKGLGISINYSGNKPDEIIASNWNTAHSYIGPFQPDFNQLLYDLYLKLLWSNKTLLPGENYSNIINIKLTNPDFSSALFLRWDLQNFLAIENGQVFPSEFNTYLQVNKSSNSSNNTANINLSFPASLTSSTSDYSLAISGNSAYQKITLKPHIVYEDKTAEISATVTLGGQATDIIKRNVFLPSAPVSDSGLVVNIDSLSTTNFPRVGLGFEAKIKSNDYKIGNLTSDNVFIYEDGNKVESFTLSKDTAGGVNSADIVFVLDVTGSMGDEIDKVKSNIIEFADSLSFRGVDYRLGMVTFLDVVENIYPFTSDVQYFQSLVSQQYAHGGDDEPENSLQGLMDASKYSFRENSSRIIIWITDATYHENDSFTNLTKSEVVNQLLLNGIVVNAIGPESYKSAFYDPIISPTGGNFYDIYGNFRDILLDISRFETSGRYIVNYTSENTQKPSQIKLLVRYAGLGGEDSVGTAAKYSISEDKYLSFYPNPFNPEITFNINKEDYTGGEIKIFNLLGELVKTIPLSGEKIVKWSANGLDGKQASSGLYIVQLIMTGKDNVKHFESAKILYLK